MTTSTLDATPDLGPVDPGLLDRIRCTHAARQVIYLEYQDPTEPQSAGWWRAQNRAYATKHIPARYAAATTDLTEIHEWVLSVSATPQSAPSLLLAGPTGTGKTHAAFAALRLGAESCVPAAWRAASSAALLGDLRPSAGRDSEAVFNTYCAAPLLFLDDLGAAKSSEWSEEILYRLIDHRYSNCLPSLFATNVRTGELAERLGDRTASRLAEMCRTVVLDGADRRRGAQ